MIGERLALGTAQLGNSVYITTPPTEQEAERILKTAWDEGVRYYDTAQAYGASEERLGRYLPAEARIITKLHPDACDEPLEQIEKRLEHSLAVLRRNHIWGLLLHRERMLDRWYQGLGELLCDWQDRGLIGHLGLSLESDQSNPFQPLVAGRRLEIMQVPFGISDRWHWGGIEKHLFVRSLYQHGQVQDRDLAIRRAVELFPKATLLIGAETAEQVADNCRMVRDECRVRVG